MPSAADSTALLLAKMEEFNRTLAETTEETHRKLEEVQIRVRGMEKSLQLVAEEQQALLDWKPEIESAVSALKNSVFDVTQKVDLFIHRLLGKNLKQEEIRINEAPDPSQQGTQFVLESPGPFGHRSSTNHRGDDTGVVTTLVPSPVKGAPMNSKIPSFKSDSNCYGETSRMHPVVASFPSINFPKFDGSNPRIWKRQCETFFSFYKVPDEMWVRMVTMYFDGSALYWLQSAEDRLLSLS